MFALTCAHALDRALQEGDERILLASDGLWDVMTNAEAAQVTGNTSRNALEAAKALTKGAWSMGSMDNISALVVDIRAIVGSEGHMALGMTGDGHVGGSTDGEDGSVSSSWGEGDNGAVKVE